MQPKPLIQKQKQAFVSFARGLSIWCIVLYHFFDLVPLPASLQQANKFGGAGIYFFFFASGYGLFFSKGSWKEFYKKRLLKVLLPYYLAVTIIYAVNQLLPLYTDGWQAYLSHLLLYKMFDSKLIYSFGYHLWFISTIIQFYVLYPMLLRAFRRFGAVQVLAASVAVSVLYSAVITYLGLSENGVAKRFVLQYLWVLVLGMYVAKAKLLEPLLGYKNYIYLGLMAAGMVAAVGLQRYAGMLGNLFNDYFMFIAFTAFCVLVYNISSRLTLIRRYVLWIESFSYAFYLVHIFVLLLYMKLVNINALQWHEVAGVLVMTIVMALALDKVIGWMNHWLDKKPKPAGNGPAVQLEPGNSHLVSEPLRNIDLSQMEMKN